MHTLENFNYENVSGPRCNMQGTRDDVSFPEDIQVKLYLQQLQLH